MNAFLRNLRRVADGLRTLAIILTAAILALCSAFALVFTPMPYKAAVLLAIVLVVAWFVGDRT